MQNCWLGRVPQFAYVVYVRMRTIIGVCMILYMRTLTRTVIFSSWFFKVFKNFLVLIILYCFKNLLLYIWPLIYLFVLGRDRFFTVYICFKETLFFIQFI